ncbi:MAG: cyclic nucleotide-binding domain-containing protein [Desulfovermiculus sp.]
MYEPDFFSMAAGQNIFSQNEPVLAVYHLLHGEISLWRDGHLGASLTAGHILGLPGAYASNGLHACTAHTECDCRVAAFDLESIPETFLAAPTMAERVFFSLSRQILHWWERFPWQGPGSGPPCFVGQVLTVEADEVLIREGENTHEFYRIISTDKGLEVSAKGSVLAILDRPGEFFGEMAAVLEQPRTATIRSLGQSALEVYPARMLPHIVSDYPELSWRIIQGLSQRLNIANARTGC